MRERITNMDLAPMSQPAVITPAFLDRILTLLAPLFLGATGGDMAAARDTVRSTLASYHVRTDNEVRLAALVVAFGFGALDALSKAANRELSLDQVMDLRDNATALSAAGHQNQAVLDRLRKPRQAEPAPDPEPAGVPAGTNVNDLRSFERSGPQARGTEQAAQPAGRRTTMH
jgi:hypothetical protein